MSERDDNYAEWLARHEAFLGDETRLAACWNAIPKERSEATWHRQHDFLCRCWPLKNLDSLERYTERVKEYIGSCDPGDTFVRRWADYVPWLISEIRRLENDLIESRRRTEGTK